MVRAAWWRHEALQWRPHHVVFFFFFSIDRCLPSDPEVKYINGVVSPFESVRRGIRIINIPFPPIRTTNIRSPKTFNRYPPPLLLKIFWLIGSGSKLLSLDPIEDTHTVGEIAATNLESVADSKDGFKLDQPA